ncbi:hypothetical protein PSUB009319_44250 [Ralstonia sp. SET104]|nr:hypothetical protein PSUB009319_44250 [Ralstonia sp. SET104]
MKRGSRWFVAMLLVVIVLFFTLCVQWSSYTHQRGLIEDSSISAAAARHPEMKAAFGALAACEERRKHGADRPPITTAFCISTVRDRAAAIERPDIVDTFDELKREIDSKATAIEVPFPLRIIL